MTDRAFGHDDGISHQDIVHHDDPEFIPDMVRCR